MKVLMISHDPNVFTPGTPVYDRMNEYRARGVDLRIVVLSGRFGIERDPLGLHGFHPDIVTAQNPFEHGILAWRYARKYRARLEFQLHTDFLSPFFQKTIFGKIRAAIAVRLLPKADHVRVVSGRIARSLEQRFPGIAARVTIAPLPLVPAPAPGESDLHKQYPQFTTIALIASRLTPEKNIPMALVAFSTVMRKHPQTGLVIIGKGREKKNLESLVIRLGLRENVIFLDWSESLGDYYRTADFFVLSSWFEGYGLTLLEAAQAGCPIVTTNVGLVGDIITSQTAWIVEPGDDRAFLAAVFEASERPDMRKQKSDALRAIAASLPTPAAHLDAVVAGWQKMLGRV